jgi:hypothetical protein
LGLTAKANGLKCRNKIRKISKKAYGFEAEVSMPNETRSVNQPMSLFQKSRSIFGDNADYLMGRMDDYPNSSSFRIIIYLLEGVLIGLFTYLWLEYAQMGKLYHLLYSLKQSSFPG